MKIFKNLFWKQENTYNVGNIDLENLPVHIAIIMDGNGRWAKKRGLPRTAGHKAGVEALRDIIRTCSRLGIKYLSLYAFSTENWKRPQEEVNGLMQLLVLYLRKEVEELHENHVKINVIGDIQGLPENARQEVEAAVARTENNDGLVVNIALNYGGRAEIIQAVKEISRRAKRNELDIEAIDEEIFSKFLYTKGIPDPDLVIRPSGELRISNFLLWQIAYSEFWFSNIYWPDFTGKNLVEAIIDYQKRDRRYGGVK
ncbi:isoprenyl transferase [Thermotalea metallivorans]|uniref:Isoprenyl transferase n=1 Tax=Thermotalea metallivorans TaxID=520762 RepID=A0A140L5G0_9FIRM|nr:isoprenyl transferase [Thermotalea metallivorans]KXG75785.1 Ditrans,polycis-undecaprenyl-diphosphate synthase ((2E,6E)-farnesyl-diphosphate specific) [Thermotalea metallivorans]